MITARSKSRVEALRDELVDKYGRLLLSPDAKELIDFLERRFFDGELLGETPEETAFNLGAREVVRVLRDLRRALVDRKEKPDDHLAR